MTTNRVIAGGCVAALFAAIGCAGSDDAVPSAPEPPATATPPIASEPEPDAEPETDAGPETEADPDAAPDAAPEPDRESTTDSATDEEPVPEPEPPAEPPPSYDFTATSEIVGDFVDERGLRGAGLIIVDRDDGVVHHEHWGEFTEDRISLVASSSKMITAGVLMRLDDDGLLDVDAPVANAVPWGDGNPAITPAQLVSNSSGLVGLIDDAWYPPYLCQWDADDDMGRCAESIFTTPEDDGDVIDPDSEFRYGGAQWQIAGAVAESASGKTWAQLIDEIYIGPCALETLGYHQLPLPGPAGFEYPIGFDDAITTLPATDNPNMEGGAYLTTGDYGQLLLMHLRDGRCGDTQVLSPEALERLHGDRVAEAYGDAYAPNNGYGMGWWIDRSTGRLTDPGAFGSVAWLDLADGYGAFLVIERDSLTGGALADLLYDVVDDAMSAA